MTDQEPTSLELVLREMQSALNGIADGLAKLEGHAEAALTVADGAREHLRAFPELIKQAVEAAAEGARG